MICTSRKSYSWNSLSLMLLSQQTSCCCNWSCKKQHSCWKPARTLKTARCYWSGIRCRASPGDANSRIAEHVCCHSPFPGLHSTAQGPRALRDVDSITSSRSNTSNETKAGSCLFHEVGSLLAKCKHKPWALHTLGKKKTKQKAIYRLQVPPDALQDILRW